MNAKWVTMCHLRMVGPASSTRAAVHKEGSPWSILITIHL